MESEGVAHEVDEGNQYDLEETSDFEPFITYQYEP